MIQGAMIESWISLCDFDIVPFPVNYPELIFSYTPREAKYYMTIYDGGKQKKGSFGEDRMYCRSYVEEKY